MKTFDATITATITMSIEAPSFASAMDKVRDTIPDAVFSKQSGGKLLYAITIDDIHLTEVSIMDSSTLHDKDLIMQINMCYAQRRELFYEIIHLLAKRDVDEFDNNIIDVNTASIKDIAYHYLHAIADDQDLQTIANYCRI